MESILNPDDDNALEAALQMKDGNTDTTVTVDYGTAPGERGSGGMYWQRGRMIRFLLSSRAFGGQIPGLPPIPLQEP